MDGHGRQPLPLRLARSIEESRALDPVVGALRPVADALVASPARAGVLQGTSWLGHAAHPTLTDLPIGAWTSAWVLDLVGGRRARPAAQLLVGLGVVAAVPTVLTGWAEWAATDQRARRVGVVHAASNATATVCYVRSYAARRRGEHARGVAWGMAGATAATVGGALGGHLAVGLGVGTRQPTLDRP